jgi:uncharacterized membrane protein YdbT with pleckstrin-like domain/CRP-like cAMP-binding protein
MAGPGNSTPPLAPSALEAIDAFQKVYVAGSRQVFEGFVREQWLHDGEILHDQDERLTHVWLLVQGTIAEARRSPAGSKTPVTLARTAGPGVWLSIYDYLFEATTYSTRAVAQETCHLLALEVRDLGRMIYQAPGLRQALADFATVGRLRTIPTLRDVPLVGLGMLAEATTHVDLAKGDVLYRSGEEFDAIGLIDKGQLELDGFDNNGQHWVGNGGMVGILPHTRSRHGVEIMDHVATATMPTALLQIPHAAFVQITGFVPDPIVVKEMQQREEIVEQLIIFRDFSPDQKRHLAGFFSYNRYPANHLLVQQDEEADSLWVLMPNSSAEVRALGEKGEKLFPAVATGPTYFAETALLGQFPQRSTVEALAGSEWLRLHWHDFEYYDIVEPQDLRSILVINAPQAGVSYGKAARQRYKWLQPGETVVYFGRRHWVGFLRKNLLGIIFFLVVLGAAVLANWLPNVNLALRAGMIVLLLANLAVFIWGIVDYRNDWIIVTNRRVYYQEKLILVNQLVREAPLEQVQNVDFQQTFIGRLLNFGTLVVQTAGSYGDIGFTYTTNFDQIADMIQRQRAQRRSHTAAQDKLKINRQLEVRLGLTVEPPGRVYGGELERTAITGWQERFSQRMGAGAVKETGGRIVWRQHWMALVGRIGWIFWIPFLAALMFIIAPFGDDANATPEVATAVQVLEIVGFVVLFIFFLRFLWVWVDWHNDTYEVTDTDVINVKRLPLGLRQDRRAAGLARIQNVEMKIPSPIHLLLDYGTVIIQTAAEDGALIFSSVPNPRYVASEISQRIERLQRRIDDEQAQRRAEDLPDWFEMYNRMNASNQPQQPGAFPAPPARPTSRS